MYNLYLVIVEGELCVYDYVYYVLSILYLCLYYIK
jgi:hypothetical protein